MAQSTIKKAIGAVKDQTSISIAKVTGNTAPELEVLVVKATSHDEDLANDKYIREIVSLCSHSSGYSNAFVVTISKRLSRTHDWIVALKALMVVHRVLIDGHPSFGEEIVFASRRGMRCLNLSDFRDEAHSNSWDYAAFVRFYALYLDGMTETLVLEKKVKGGNGGCSEHGDKSDYERQIRRSLLMSMTSEMVLEKLNQLLRRLDRVLACRPTGMAKSSRLVISALYLVVKESFELYIEICEALEVLLDHFKKMDYGDCVRTFDVYVNAAKKIDELVGYYVWCKDMGIARSSEYPQVQRITHELLSTLGGFLKEMTRKPDDFKERRMEEKPPPIEQDMNEIRALPPPETYALTQPVAQTKQQDTQQPKEDLVNLREEFSEVDQGNRLALALFSGPPITNTDGTWETFSSEPEVASDWELALVESSSNMSKQKADMGGGFDPLLLHGMYDQWAIRQFVRTEQLGSGSSSSVAMGGQGKAGTQLLLALPTPEGIGQVVGHQDPFAASLLVPPPSYVQMAEMEKKQQLLVQEQLIWRQYGGDGMHGQVGLAKIAGGSAYIGLNPQPNSPHGMPWIGGMGQGGTNYFAPF